MKKNETELLIRRARVRNNFPTVHIGSNIGGIHLSRCVVANPACYRFRHHHRPKWRHCPWSQRYACQPRHWIET